MNSTQLLLRLKKAFGIKSAIILFFKFKLNKLNNIKIPGINSPIKLRKGTSDIPTFFQVFFNNEYNIKFEGDPKVIIDGGANIGLFTLAMANKHPNATIISIEPDPENFHQLVENVAFYKKVSPLNCGLWNKNSKLKVYDKYNAGKWGIVVEENDQEGNINGITINSVMDRYSLTRIDILKLDVETSEKEIFSENFENWLPKTKVIIVELHDFMCDGCSRPFFEAINRTIKDYTYSVIGENTVIVNNDLEY